jgi:hypothetical protein
MERLDDENQLLLSEDSAAPSFVIAATTALAAAKQRVRELFAELFEEVVPSPKKR